jgi:UPF0755 protein
MNPEPITPTATPPLKPGAPKTSRLRIWPYVAGLVVLGALLLVQFIFKFNHAIRPRTPGAPPHYIRLNESRSLRSLFREFQDDAIINDASAADLYAWLTRARGSVEPGTYSIGPGMGIGRLIRALHNPIHQMVRIREGRWAARVARRLESDRVCTANAYLAATKKPGAFKGGVDFPVPPDSLEGYLYPDTYDLPPLLGAEGTISRQLKAFQSKVYNALGHPKDLQKLVTIASLIELEVRFDDERPLVASVIVNRLKRKMPLQIDASLNYGLGVMRPLAKAELHTVQGPYNLYTHLGLPPGPICSPSVKSVEAALHPAPTDYLYYVALPSGHSLFAKTYQEHLRNVAKRHEALKLVPTKSHPLTEREIHKALSVKLTQPSR